MSNYWVFKSLLSFFLSFNLGHLIVIQIQQILFH
jgi:hypothetical protein